MEGYNPQYINWKQGNQSGYDWVDCLNFILIAYAEVLDGELTPDEWEKIKEINEITFAHWVGDGMPYASNEPEMKLKRAHKWYFDILDNNPEDLIDQKVQKELREVVNFIKSQDWFNPTFAQSIINWLVEVAAADGNVLANEVGSINSLAEYFGVQKPF